VSVSVFPKRRTLSLIVRGDGAVCVMYTVSRDDLITQRQCWGLVRTDGEMASILAEHPVVAQLNYVLPRIQIGRHRVSPFHSSEAKP
jgi:hypothetical protein